MPRKFEGEELVLATNNPGKVAEINRMFEGKNIAVQTMDELGVDSPEETEDNFLGNALIKAKYVSEKTGKPCLADDSGLCVDALDGAPGVYTADWAVAEDGSYDTNNATKKIEKLLAGNPNTKAHFVCCFVLYWPDGHYETVEGQIDGNLTFPARGENGFGQDPIFVPEDETRTFAEMTKDEKAKYSHRAKAFELMMDKCFK